MPSMVCVVGIKKDMKIRYTTAHMRIHMNERRRRL